MPSFFTFKYIQIIFTDLCNIVHHHNIFPFFRPEKSKYNNSTDEDEDVETDGHLLSLYSSKKRPIPINFFNLVIKEEIKCNRKLNT